MAGQNAPKPPVQFFGTSSLELYQEIEELLRIVIKRAILDSTFAEIFSSDERIRNKWPIS
jgi:hypothetical protein